MTSKARAAKTAKAAPKTAQAELGKARKQIEKTDGEKLSEMELSLTVLWNSVRRWLAQRSNANAINGLSDLDVFLLHLLVYRNKPLRGIDLAFALSIDDLHLVSYALKKLAKLDMITSSRAGKEVFYQATAKGRENYDEFISDRERYLEPAMGFLQKSDIDIEALNLALRTLSGIYEQAARAAASARGI
jgi:predicted MarR family transcription regulator